MKKFSFFLAVVLLLLVSQTGFSSPVTVSDTGIAVTEETVEVQIELVDIHGDPVSGSVMVSDFYAIDQEIGDYFYAERNGLFRIPPGTYRFDAGRTGPWEGVVPEVVTISEGETRVVVELTHWYE